MSESKPDIDAGYAEAAAAETAAADSPHSGPAGEGYCIDTSYLRSLEGIFRMIELVVVVIAFILTIVGYIVQPAGWFFFVAISYSVYIVVVIVIEVFVPGIYIHRLIDGIVSIVYAVFWLVAGVVNIAFAARFSNGVLGAAAFFACVLCGLTVVSAILAFLTWRTYEQGTRGSKPIFMI